MSRDVKLVRYVAVDKLKEEIDNEIYLTESQKSWFRCFVNRLQNKTEVHAKWIPLYSTSDGWRYECSNCLETEIITPAKIKRWKGCPNCLAVMDLGVEDNNGTIF